MSGATPADLLAASIVADFPHMRQNAGFDQETSRIAVPFFGNLDFSKLELRMNEKCPYPETTVLDPSYLSLESILFRLLFGRLDKRREIFK